MDAAEQLGYEVRILERVPDSGDARRRGHNRVLSESDKGVGGGGGVGLGTELSVTDDSVRYREQSVDKLLQLKLHQAIAIADVPQPGAMIVLATGDGPSQWIML